MSKEITKKEIEDVFKELFKEENFPSVTHYKDDEIECWTLRIPPSEGQSGVLCTIGRGGYEYLNKIIKEEFNKNYGEQ